MAASILFAATAGFLAERTFTAPDIHKVAKTVETVTVQSKPTPQRTGMEFTGSQGIILACIAGVLIFTLLLFIYRLLRKTPPVGKTRFGFFIEHDFMDTEIPVRRSVYDYENTHDYPIIIPTDPAEEKTHPNWPDTEKPGDSI